MWAFCLLFVISPDARVLILTTLFGIMGNAIAVFVGVFLAFFLSLSLEKRQQLARHRSDIQRVLRSLETELKKNKKALAGLAKFWKHVETQEILKQFPTHHEDWLIMKIQMHESITMRAYNGVVHTGDLVYLESEALYIQIVDAYTHLGDMKEFIEKSLVFEESLHKKFPEGVNKLVRSGISETFKKQLSKSAKAIRKCLESIDKELKSHKEV